MKYQESDTVELKPSVSQLNEIVETVAGFANSKGGKIMIGVSNKGEIIGIEIGKSTLEKLVNTIKQNTEPKQYPKVATKTLGGKNFIEITISESKEKPVLAFGRAFKRVGKSTLKVDKDEHERMVLEKKKVYFDAQICGGATITDIDEESVRKFLEKAITERRLNLSARVQIKEVLERLGLAVKNKMTNAAILLFGKNPQQYFLSAEVRCAIFKGIEPLEFIDMKVFGGNIINQREDAVEFVQKHIRLHAKIVGTERIETWEYPLEAIREAITNALCHRDYEISSNVQVRIFDDRMEIWGCGNLPKSLHVEDLKKKHNSVLRNPLLAKGFFLIKYIEHWGTGTNRIIKECVQHGLPEPLFEIFSGNVVVTLRKFRINDEDIKDLNERQKKAIEFIQQKGRITSREYCQVNEVVKDTANRDIQEMVKKGLLATEGTGKKIRYVLR